MTWSLRVLRLAVALRLVDDKACGDRARAIAEAAAHDASTGLADDPVAAAAHDFERVLPAFIARLALARSDDAVRAAEQLRDHIDAEAWIRIDAQVGLGADAFLERQIELMFRVVWSQFAPWTEGALRDATAVMRRVLHEIPLRRDVRVGQVNNAFYETPLEHDPLWPGTRNIIQQVATLPAPAGQGPETDVRSAFASELLGRYFTTDPCGRAAAPNP
jgi:hypothetical protein